MQYGYSCRSASALSLALHNSGWVTRRSLGRTSSHREGRLTRPILYTWMSAPTFPVTTRSAGMDTTT